MEKRQMCGDGKMPYFLTNPKWYYRDKYGGLRLAKDAPPEARKSYEEFSKTQNQMKIVASQNIKHPKGCFFIAFPKGREPSRRR